jgi:hypothetical protein
MLQRAHMQAPRRQALPAAKLYAILDREFKERRSPQCRSCAVPLPYYQRPADDVSANWFIGTPHECEYGCHLVIAELLVQLWTRYDLDRTPTG